MHMQYTQSIVPQDFGRREQNTWGSDQTPLHEEGAELVRLYQSNMKIEMLPIDQRIVHVHRKTGCKQLAAVFRSYKSINQKAMAYLHQQATLQATDSTVFGPASY